MGRGQSAEIGTHRVAQNGYHYDKVANRGDGKPGWRLSHHIVAEQKLGRPLGQNERVSFKDGNKDNLLPSNIVVSEKGRSSLRHRKAVLEQRIEELQAELKIINKELEK